jgi:hypothetical protein
MVTSWPMEENEVMETTHRPIVYAHHSPDESNRLSSRHENSSTTFYCHCHYSLSYQLVLVDSLMPVRSHVDECVVFVDPPIKSTAAASTEAKRHVFWG